MDLIAKLLPPAHILLDLEASSKKRAFEQAGLLFENNLGIARATVFDSLFARENSVPPAWARGCHSPRPHQGAQGSRRRLHAPVRPGAFRFPDGKPVGLMFVLLVPEQATEQHLQILSELAQRFSDRAFREALGACDNTDDAHRLFTDWGNHAANLHQPAV